MSLLEVDELSAAYRVQGEWREAVRNVSFRIEQGQTYGLVGESGSGKSTLALAIMRYLPQGGVVRQGSVRFMGRNLLELSEAEMRNIWGGQMALVPQDPLSSLNPSLRIGEQLAEMLRQHSGLQREDVGRRSLELLEMVQIADPPRILGSYPHQLSGGMQQRVMIAMALSTEPELLVLDEPTTNLDATTQAAVLDLMGDLMRQRQTAALYVTHNLGVIAQVCDCLAVLYAGELVEQGRTEALYRQPLHPYTRGLLDSVPRLGENKSQIRLRPIQGRIPSLEALPSGCIFRTRCPIAIEICDQYPPLYQLDANRRSRCHRWEEIAAGEVSAKQPLVHAPARTYQEVHGRNVLKTEGLRVHYSPGRSMFEHLRGSSGLILKAVDGVDLEIQQAQTLGLVGESGSGKTTLARAVVGLVRRTGGSIELLDELLPAGLKGRSLDTLTRLQIVFQSPQEALNPYLSVGQSLRRPLQRLLGLSAKEAEGHVLELLEAVHLSDDYARRLPSQLSGGEKQRVAIARAFASNPDLLLADEPVSSLDVSVQASILNLLSELQSENGSAYLFISHDLSVVGYLADKVAVIYLGHLMEVADAMDLFEAPYHPYTESLLSAIPLIEPEAEQEYIRLEGELPSPVDVPTGCPFHTRCPHFLGEICVNEEPPWRATGAGKRYFCHIPEDELRALQGRAFSQKRSGGDGS